MTDISVGLDLATSASIIGASIAYIISEQKRRSAEREWRRQLTSQKQVELSHSIVNDVLAFMQVITATARKVHESVQNHRPKLPDGTYLVTSETVAKAIREEAIQLREKLEFELLRPLEVKVDFVDGHDVWNREAAKCRAKLDTVQQAMNGLVTVCADPNFSDEDKRKMLAQAVPLLAASEPIGGTIDSTYTAVIELAKGLKIGLLEMQITS